MAELTGQAGFARLLAEQKMSIRRNVGIELIATLALAISLIVAATAVSINVVRGHAAGAAAAVGTGLSASATPAPGADYSPFRPAALIIGHHFSMSAC